MSSPILTLGLEIAVPVIIRFCEFIQFPEEGEQEKMYYFSLFVALIHFLLLGAGLLVVYQEVVWVKYACDSVEGLFSIFLADLHVVVVSCIIIIPVLAAITKDLTTIIILKTHQKFKKSDIFFEFHQFILLLFLSLMISSSNYYLVIVLCGIFYGSAITITILILTVKKLNELLDEMDSFVLRRAQLVVVYLIVGYVLMNDSATNKSLQSIAYSAFIIFTTDISLLILNKKISKAKQFIDIGILMVVIAHLILIIMLKPECPNFYFLLINSILLVFFSIVQAYSLLHDWSKKSSVVHNEGKELQLQV